MKLTPQEKKIWTNFEPGNISKNGFLGNDKRHIHDIIQEDLRILEISGVTKEDIAGRLQLLIDKGKKGVDTPVEYGNYRITVFWSRGMLPCPFGEPRLHDKITATVIHKKLNKEIKFSQLNVHLIKEHGFFEGKGSSFRIEPHEIISFLEIEK